MSNLEELFFQYEDLAIQLDTKTQEYVQCFFKQNSIHLQEQYLKEKIDSLEKQSLDKKIQQLEIDIQTLYEEFLFLTEEISKRLLHCEMLDFSIVNTLNYEHFEVTRHYDNVIKGFHSLEKFYKKYDFSWIDFSKMERQRKELNIVIKQINTQLLKNCSFKLLDVYEQEKALYQMTIERLGSL